MSSNEPEVKKWWPFLIHAAPGTCPQMQNVIGDDEGPDGFIQCQRLEGHDDEHEAFMKQFDFGNLSMLNTRFTWTQAHDAARWTA